MSLVHQPSLSWLPARWFTSSECMGTKGFCFIGSLPLRESTTITQLENVPMALWYHGAEMAKSQFGPTAPINTTIHNLCTACSVHSSHFCLSSLSISVSPFNSLLLARFRTLQMSAVWSTASPALTSGPYWLPLGSHISQRGSTVVLEGKLSPSGWRFHLQPQEGYKSFSR